MTVTKEQFIKGLNRALEWEYAGSGSICTARAAYLKIS